MATGQRSTAEPTPPASNCQREGGRSWTSGWLPPGRPSLPPSQLPKVQEHLAAGLAPGGVSGCGASFRQAPSLLWCKAHQSRLQGWLMLGREPAPSPPPPQTFLRNGISFPVHLLPTRRALPSTVCTFRPHQPCLFLGKEVPQGGLGGVPDPNPHQRVPPWSSTLSAGLLKEPDLSYALHIRLSCMSVAMRRALSHYLHVNRWKNSGSERLTHLLSHTARQWRRLPDPQTKLFLFLFFQVVFPHWMVLAPLSKSVELRRMDLFLEETLTSIPVFWMSSLGLIPHHLDYHCSVVSFEIWKCESSCFILLFQGCFGYSGSLEL